MIHNSTRGLVTAIQLRRTNFSSGLVCFPQRFKKHSTTWDRQHWWRSGQGSFSLDRGPTSCRRHTNTKESPNTSLPEAELPRSDHDYLASSYFRGHPELDVFFYTAEPFLLQSFSVLSDLQIPTTEFTGAEQPRPLLHTLSCRFGDQRHVPSLAPICHPVQPCKVS